VGSAQVDRVGNLNTTDVPGGPFLVGSGGANDVVTTADETVVVTLLDPGRTPERVGYVTSPGERVRTVVTDRGVLRRRDGELRLAAVPTPVDAGVRDAVAACGWELEAERDVTALAPVSQGDALALRAFDRRGWFLGS
jgi:acyl CoA:acetate/3-ketoacid CoA transferase beta subunit